MPTEKATQAPEPRAWPKSHIAAFVLGAVLVVALVAFLTQHEYNAAVDLWKTRLTASVLYRVWTLRVSLQQSEDDTRIVASLAATRDVLSAKVPASSESSRNQLISLFDSYRKIFEYAAIYLLNADGQPVMQDTRESDWQTAFRSPEFKEALETAKATGSYSVNIVPASASELALVFVMPVYREGSGSSPNPTDTLGVVVILDHFTRELLPLILAESVPTGSGETLLLQVAKGTANYASKRRFADVSRAPGPADSLVMAAPSAMGESASFGLFTDYRGIEVMAAMQSIPAIDSVVISKVDSREALADFHRMARLQVLAGVAILAAYAGLIVVHRRNTAARAMQESLLRQELANRALETKVTERTAELATANQQLQVELREREAAESKVRKLNAELEERVRSRTAQLEYANKELEAFSFSVSHDLQAPLRAINTYTAILLEDHGSHLPEAGLQTAGLIQKHAVLMGELIEGLLTLSRYGRQELHILPLNTTDLVRRVWDELLEDNPGTQVDVAISDLPACNADPLLLKQVFVNLLSNAIKYSRKQESPKVEIGTTGSAYFVRDNGVGFDMKHADRLFGVFQRLHRADDFEGTGIGLSIVRRIVLRHGGRIWAEAEVNKGATFYFTLSSNGAPAA